MSTTFISLKRSAPSPAPLHDDLEPQDPSFILRNMPPKRQIPDEADLATLSENMFSFLDTAERKWALDFLLAYESDPAGDVSGLSNSVTYSQGHSSLRFCVASPAPPSPGSSSEDWKKEFHDSPPGTLAFELNFLAIPVWQAAGVCVGVAIQQSVGRHGKSNKFLRIPGAGPEPRAVACGRFAIDVHSGTSTEILVAKDPTREKESVVQVTHCKLKGTQKSVQTTIQANSAAMDSQRAPSERFADACLMFRETETSRICPLCSKGSDDKCHCTHDFATARGALDFNFFRKNAACLYGTESGTSTTIQRWTVDKPFVSCKMFVECTSASREGGGCFDPLSIALRNFVIQDKAQSSGRVSREQRMPIDDTGREELPSRNFEGSLGSSSHAERVGNTTAVPEPPDDVVFMDLAETMDLERANFPFLAVGETSKEKDGDSSKVGLVDEHDSELALIFGSPAREREQESQVLDREPESMEPSFEAMDLSAAAELDALVEGDKQEYRRVARQMRNRAAAARSNEKRKQRRIDFQEEMERANSRKRELEEVLENLKAENAVLKERSAELLTREKQSEDSKEDGSGSA